MSRPPSAAWVCPAFRAAGVAPIPPTTLVTRAADGLNRARRWQEDHAHSAGVEEAGLVREHDRLDPVSEVELHQDMGDVGLHGGVADEELPPDLGVRQASRNQPEHLELTLGELAELPRRL